MITAETLLPYHKDAIELLRMKPVASVPRAVCHGAALRHLETLGLVQKAGIPGFWSVTDEGREVDLTVERKSYTHHLPWEPEGEAREQLASAYQAIDGLMPGSPLFGQPVRQSALDEIEGKLRHLKFIYFAYPLGFPLKHIAWAVRADRPLWTDTLVSMARRVNLKMPAMRMKARRSLKERQEETDLRRALRAEGMQEWEIAEYFALSLDGPTL